MPLRRAALLTLGASCTLAVPAVAGAAPSLGALKPCYVSVRTAPKTFDTETVAVSGSGFSPNALIDIAVDGATVATGVQADGAGNLAPGTVKAPVVKSGQRAFTVTATAQGDAGQSASAGALVSELAVRVRPRRARPRRRIRFTGAGFTIAGLPVYAHYVLNGRLRETVRLAPRPTGPCGTFSVRRRQFPFTPRTGRWTVQFDQRQAFTDEPPLVGLLIDVKRVPRTPRR